MSGLEQQYLNRIRDLTDDLFRKDRIIDNLQNLIDEQNDRIDSLDEVLDESFEELGLLQMFLQSQGYSQSDIEEFKIYKEIDND